MITLTFAQRENIGFQYVLDTLRPSSPYGSERVRELRPFLPEERPELERQLSNIQRVLEGEAACQSALNQLLRVFMTVKHIRPTVEKCLETSLNEIELFEVKCFLLRCHEMLPLFQQVQSALQWEGIGLEDTVQALDLLDPERNRVASFFISDNSSPLLRSLRREKRELGERGRGLGGGEEREDGAVSGNVFGTYLHGVLESGELLRRLWEGLARRKGLDPGAEPAFDPARQREETFGRLAAALRESLDMELIYRILEEGI